MLERPDFYSFRVRECDLIPSSHIQVKWEEDANKDAQRRGSRDREAEECTGGATTPAHEACTVNSAGVQHDDHTIAG